MNKIYYRQDILQALQEKYPGEVNTELESLTIVQTKKNLFLEKSYKSEPNKYCRTSIDFIADDDFIELEPIISASLFNPQLLIEENVGKFVNELDKQAIEYCFDDIFV